MPNLHRKFSPEVAARLRYYVYRLIDPRTGETFYVGKGVGDRVFAHARAQIDQAGDMADNKMRRIQEIRRSGFDVTHVIHRHGMDEKTATEVEAALIDAYSGLDNEVSGAGSGDFGVAHADELVTRYKAPEAVFKHRAILINVNRSSETKDWYEAVRHAWKLSRPKAERAQLVFAVVQGIIRAVFVPTRWLKATPENFPGTDVRPGRLGFEGEPAPPDVATEYLKHRVPDGYRKKGAANPIRYVNL